MFSLEQLLFSVASDVRTNAETLENMLPMLKEVHERENKEREEIKVNNISAQHCIITNSLLLFHFVGIGCESNGKDDRKAKETTNG